MSYAQALEALKTKIVIQSDADFTPQGKRSARIVSHKMNGRKCGKVIRCYVSGKYYMERSLSEFESVNQWLQA